MTNCGSSGSRPMATSIVLPALSAIVPCSSSGIATHYYFLMPP